MRFAVAISRRFALSAEDERILGEQVQALDRRSRRAYHTRLAPRIADFAKFLRAELQRSGSNESASQWAMQIGTHVVLRGYATIAEQIAMEVVGRKKVSDVVRALRSGPTMPTGAERLRGGHPGGNSL